METRLTPTDNLSLSAYNPRITDPSRLRLIRLSLQKLGFLLPLFATPDGQLISGHQRLLATQDLGWTEAPVQTLPDKDLRTRRYLNILFNHATNDITRPDTSYRLTERLQAATTELQALAEELPDAQGDGRFPCIYAVEPRPIAPLLAANRGRFVAYVGSRARQIDQQANAAMPIILRPDQTVVNGIGRLEYAARLHLSEVPVIELDEPRAALADPLLNLLTMDFDIHNRYRDDLRFNAFRRASHRRHYIGNGIIAPYCKITGKRMHGKDLLTNQEQQQQFLAFYGTSILDFGAGHLTETGFMRQMGARVTAFEPYCVPPPGGHADVNPDLSRQVAWDFLQDVAAGIEWDTIFLSTVLNSVPFREDREKIIRIIAACATEKTTFYPVTEHTGSMRGRRLRGADSTSRTSLETISFQLDFEPYTSLIDVTSTPKIQRLHTPTEFRELLSIGFNEVTVLTRTPYVIGVCRNPKHIPPEDLDAALAFEFNLPYADGSTMGLVDEARDAFRRRADKLRTARP